MGNLKTCGLTHFKLQRFNVLTLASRSAVIACSRLATLNLVRSRICKYSQISRRHHLWFSSSATYLTNDTSDTENDANKRNTRMNWSATVLTGLSSDTEPTILVTFDSAKYLFNAGENTNRAFMQSRKNWKKMRGVFFTDVGLRTSSGLPGAFVMKYGLAFSVC